MSRVGKVSMSGKQIGHAADLASAHGVGLARQAERPRTRPADLRGSEMQVDERRILRRSARRLIQPLAVERKGRARARKQVCRLHDLFRLDTAQRAGVLRSEFLDGRKK